MPAETDKRTLVRALEQRILTRPGMAPPEMRTNAFKNSDLNEPLSTLLDKVANRSFQVTDEDFAATVAAGYRRPALRTRDLRRRRRLQPVVPDGIGSPRGGARLMRLRILNSGYG